jgi:proteasome lid subunit RPN8/RPN11
MDEEPRDNEDRKPVWQASEKERQIDADAYHIWTPRPLIRSVYWRPDPEPPRDAVSGSYEVFLDQRAFITMHEHVWKAEPGRSQFGYLIGDLCEDPTASRRFVIVTNAVPSRFPFLEAGPEQIGAEASVALQLEVERRRGVLVGWYHSHLAGPAVLSPEDVATHERLFADPWQVAFLFVADPRAPAGACFRRTPEGLDRELRLPFYEMVTNESLLAKGVRRSRVDWENVSTLDEVRLEPPPRPEPPPLPDPLVDIGPTLEPDQEPEPVLEPEPAAEPESVLEAEPADKPDPETPAPPVDEDPAVKEETIAEAGEELPEEIPGETSVEAPTELDQELDEELEDGPVMQEEDEDLDFDALIAEVQNAGLSDEELEAEAEELETGYDLDGELESDLEIVPVSDSELDGKLEIAPVAELEVEADLIAGVESPSPAEDMVDAPPETRPAETEPREALEALVGLESELISEALVEAETELSSEPAALIEPATASAEASVSVPAPEKGRILRNRILAGAGIVIALGVLGVLIPFLVAGDDGAVDTGLETAPAAVEVPVDELPAEDTGAAGDPSAGVVEDPGTDVPPDAEVALDETVESAEVAVPTPVAVDPVSLDELQELSDTVLESISTYYGRDGAFSGGEIGCPELQTSFAEVMDSWIDYSTRGKAGWGGRLPPDLVERDERLYLGVQDVERLFEASSCPRP